LTGTRLRIIDFFEPHHFRVPEFIYSYRLHFSIDTNIFPYNTAIA